MARWTRCARPWSGISSWSPEPVYTDAVTVTTDERLHRDIYPAEVLAPGQLEHPRKARVFITDSRLLVWSSTASGTPDVLIDEAITGDVPQRTRATLQGEMRVETAKGTVFVTRGEGCGCKDRLRSVDPPVPW